MGAGVGTHIHGQVEPLLAFGSFPGTCSNRVSCPSSWQCSGQFSGYIKVNVTIRDIRQIFSKTNCKLRKWVLKSDITKIRKLIMDGANPNFISQQVPDSKSTHVSFQIDLV